MKSKDILFKIVCPCLVVLLISIALLVIFLPKSNNKPLTISSNNVTLNVNEEYTLTFEVSNPYAVVTFDIENENIVSSNGFKIKAIQEGETTIELFAKYNSQTATCQCEITVVEKDNETSQPDNDENLPDDMNPTNPSETEDEDKNSSSDYEEDDNNTNIPEDGDSTNNNYIKFEIVNQSGCQIDGTTIRLTKNKNGYFQLSSDEFENWQDCTFETTADIQISKITTGFNSWKITAQENGNLKIIYQGKEIGEINIIVL